MRYEEFMPPVSRDCDGEYKLSDERRSFSGYETGRVFTKVGTEDGNEYLKFFRGSSAKCSPISVLCLPD